MKTKLIKFRDTRQVLNNATENSLVWAFNTCGVYIDTILTLSNNDEAGFQKEFEYLKDAVENLIIIDSEAVTFNIKESIAKMLNLPLVENVNAKKLLNEHRSKGEQNLPDDLALMPDTAIVLPNSLGAYQGYMVEDKKFTVIVLPEREVEATTICKHYVLPYFEKKLNIETEKLCFKIFGVEVKELESVLQRAKDISSDGAFVNYVIDHGDILLNITAENKDTKLLFDETVRFLANAFKGKIYAEENVSLEKRLFELLSYKSKTLSVAESFTAGRIASAVVSTPGASKVFHEGIVAYSNDAKMKRLGVKEETLKDFGAVSKETAYEMAVGLLKDGKTDVAIATTGIAGPDKDGTDKPVGLCYIAAGTKEGIRINKFIFGGGRENVTELAKNTALFLGIQTLKKI